MPSVYLHDPKFYKMDIMFRSCIYTPTSMLLKFVFKTQNYFTKFSKFKSCWFFLFQADRPTGPVDRRQCQDVHVCARLSVDRPGRPTECTCSRFFWVDRSGRPQEESCAVFCGGRPDRSTGANGSLPAELAVDRPGRPPSLLLPNGSFLFCAILKSVFWSAFWQTFTGFSSLFSEQIRSK